MHAVVDARKAEIGAAHLRVGFAGSFPSFIVNTQAVIHDAFSTVALVMVLVLASIFLFFRDVRSTPILGIAVVVAVAMTFGLTRLVIGYLNTQTAFLGSIVIGNGINYGLIYLTRVRQLRRAGVALEPACEEAAPVAAQATLLASAASSVSFGMLILAANRGFRHFGFIGGIGMLLCWVSTFALCPALLAVSERIRPVEPDPRRPSAERQAPAWLRRAFSRPASWSPSFRRSRWPRRCSSSARYPRGHRAQPRAPEQRPDQAATTSCSATRTAATPASASRWPAPRAPPLARSGRRVLRRGAERMKDAALRGGHPGLRHDGERDPAEQEDEKLALVRQDGRQD